MGGEGYKSGMLLEKVRRILGTVYLHTFVYSCTSAAFFPMEEMNV